MNDTTIIILVIVFGAALAAFIYFRLQGKKKKKTDSVYDNLPIKFPKVFPYTYTTPKDAWVSSVVAISETKRAAVFSAIDRGIDNQIRATKAKFPHWTSVRTHYDYNIAFIEPDKTNMDGSPAILVGGYQSAGTVIGINNDGVQPANIVLPHQNNQDWRFEDYLMRSVWHESEHYAEWFNDKAVFAQYTGAGDVHPHHPLPSGETESLGLLGKKPIVCGYEPNVGKANQEYSVTGRKG